MKQSVCILGFFLVACLAQAQQVTTFAGFLFAGYQDGPLATAQFNGPNAACFDAAGNMYVADKFNNKIRKISTDGIVTTLAGSGEGFADGVGNAAMFFYPTGICINSTGDLFVLESFNHRVRKVTQAGVVTTVAGSTAGNTNGVASMAKFNFPEDICIDSADNLYIADYGNNQIRKITPEGMVSTLAGSTMGNADGIGTAAKFWAPSGICIDANNNLYVTDVNNHRIRKITPLGVVTTLAGTTWGYTDGPANVAQFNSPSAICIDNNGNLYIANSGTHNIRKIDATGNVTTYAGGSTAGDVDGIGTDARFAVPMGVCIAPNGIDIYVFQNNYGKIRKITPILSAEDFKAKNIAVYPNPCKDKFSINSDEKIRTIYIYDMVGKLVYVTECINNEVYIEDKLNKGVYFVQLFSEKKDIFTSKLIVE